MKTRVGEDQQNGDGKARTEDVAFVGVAALPMVEDVVQDDVAP
jgi:hypothetical protein